MVVIDLQSPKTKTLHCI